MKAYLEFKKKYESKITTIINQFEGLNLKSYEVNDLATELIHEFIAEDHLHFRKVSKMVKGELKEVDFGFNPNAQYLDAKGKVHSIQFVTYVYKFVFNRLMNLRSKRNGYTSGKFVSLYAEMSQGDDTFTMADTIADKKHFVNEIQTEDFMETIRKELRKMPKCGKCDLEVLFDCMAEQMHDVGRINMAAIAKKFGVSSSAVVKWVQTLRTVPVFSQLKVEMA